MLNIFFPPLIVGFIISFLLTPFGIRFAKLFNLIDDPKTHKHPAIIHNKPIPRAGGLSIFLAIAIGVLIFFPLNRVFISILISGSIVVVLGLLDDKYDLSPYFRFFMNIVCASIVVFAGITIPFITNPLGGILHFNEISLNFLSFNLAIPIAGIFAVIWIVWVMNMLNWSKGVDGQMPGIAAISAVVIGIAALRFPMLNQFNIQSSQMAFLVAGAALGFIPFNFYPAKIFPGYSSTILGFIIGTLSILEGVKLATAVLVMGVVMTDAIFTIFRRIMLKKSPFKHDKGHLHHVLLDLGFGQRSIAFFYWGMSLLLGFIALSLSSKGKLFAIILVVVFVSAIIASLKFITKRESNA